MWDAFVPRFKVTLELGVCAMMFAVIVGIPVGVLAAVKRGSIFDHTSVSLPLTGFMLIDTLFFGEPGDFIDAVMHMILPAVVLGTIPLSVIVRMTRSAMLEVLGEDYIRTARACRAVPRYAAAR